jgi:hypothetical protein
MVFRDHGFFFPNMFCWFLFGMNRDEDKNAIFEIE